MPTEPSLYDVYTAVMSLDGRMQVLEATVRTDNQARADHEARIRSVERWLYALPATLVLSVGSVVLAILKV